MKTQSKKILEMFTSADVKQLLTITEETLAHHVKAGNKKIFTAAQLHEIHKRKKDTSARRQIYV